MATSPFELFRRNLKPLMIALTVLAMFAFVVLPALESYLQTQRPGGPTQTTVASYEGGTFDINEIDYFNRNHNLTLRFLSALAEKTIERGGSPQVPGFAQDPQTGAIQSLGINSTVSRQAAVTAKLFAERAEKMGMQLDDAALRSWLDRFVDSKLTSAEINGMLTTATDNQLGQFHMYEQLRTHLLASAAQQVVSAGLVGGNQWLTTPPAEQFDLFRRLNQQAVITAYPVLVHDFLDKVTGEPTEAEIEELYEDGKERYPDEMSSKPAFRRPATRAFEFVTADTERFLEEEIKTISEEDLRAEYEQQLEGGQLRMPQTSDGSSTSGLDLSIPSEIPASDQPSVENGPAPGADAPSDSEPSEIEADNAGAADGGEAPAEENAPAEPDDESAEPDDESAEPDDESAEPDDENAEPEDENAESDDVSAEPDDENAEPDENAAMRRSSNPLRLVAFAPQDEDADSPADAADEPAETPAQAEDSPAESPEPTEPAEPEEPATDTAEATAPAEQPVREDEPDVADAEADQTPAPAEDAEPMQEQEDAAQPEETAEPEPPSFEEVREDIARQLASGPATEKGRAAIRKVTDAMRRYFTRKAIYEGGAGKTAEPPVRPNLKAMAEELGLEYGKTEPLNLFELQDHPLGNTATRGMDMRGGERLPNLVFEGNLPIESPIQTESISRRQPYVSWIIAMTEEAVPDLSEVRDEVVAHWREQRARELAEQAAQELAAKANESGQPLSELVPEDRKSLVAEEIGPFPWMLWLGPGRRPIEWRVQELDRTGEEFMQQVFFQPLDQFAAAPNAPKTVYYTVKTSERTPATEELRDRFLRSDERRPVTALAGEAVGQIQQGYFASFQKELGLEWTEE